MYILKMYMQSKNSTFGVHVQVEVKQERTLATCIIDAVYNSYAIFTEMLNVCFDMK